MKVADSGIPCRALGRGLSSHYLADFSPLLGGTHPGILIVQAERLEDLRPKSHSCEEKSKDLNPSVWFQSMGYLECVSLSAALCVQACLHCGGRCRYQERLGQGAMGTEGIRTGPCSGGQAEFS